MNTGFYPVFWGEGWYTSQVNCITVHLWLLIWPIALTDWSMFKCSCLHKIKLTLSWFPFLLMNSEFYMIVGFKVCLIWERERVNGADSTGLSPCSAETRDLRRKHQRGWFWRGSTSHRVLRAERGQREVALSPFFLQGHGSLSLGPTLRPHLNFLKNS